MISEAIAGEGATHSMSRRDEWRPVLAAEVKRRSSMPLDQVIEELRENQAYEVSFGSKKYQVEAEIVENTDSYIHISVAVDDGRLPWALVPVCEGVILRKTGRGDERP